MSSYAAPLSDIQFVLEEIAGLEDLSQLPGYEAASRDTVSAVIEEAGRLASDVLAPLNYPGDREGIRFENGVVRTASGFAEAYKQFSEGGWHGITVPEEWGGQNLPHAVGTATTEIWNAANMSFALCPLLMAGALDLLLLHGSEEQQRTYLPNLVSGTWTGTMNLTEPHAGTDVGALKTRAVRENGHYRIKGQKIYITYGEHDMAENIVHMVLARTPDAPAGTKGISLFIVPKYLVNEDGSLGQRNDLRCVSVEHKLGIHASPTCVMAYGDNEGAIGYLVGEENRGMEYMFTMMNTERIGVGIQGVGLAERAYQHAVGYAKERKQSRALGSSELTPVSIIEHPNVRQKLALMRAMTEAGRALAYAIGAALDHERHGDTEEVRTLGRAKAEVLTPVVKAWLTDMACEVTSIGIQVHGGMGFIEETGAAQYYRDVRILPIYEGTNDVQALDLVMRKTLRDKGANLNRVVTWLREQIRQTTVSGNQEVRALSQPLGHALDRLQVAADWILSEGKADLAQAAAAAAPFQTLAGYTAGGVLMGASAAAAAKRLTAQQGDASFNARKIKTAAFYVHNVLPFAEAEYNRAVKGGASTLAFTPEDF